MPEAQGDVLTCLACGEKGVGIGFKHDCDPIAARRERARCAAYVYDRAHQYDNSSGIHAALCEVAHELEKGEAKRADEHGDLDDLLGSKRLPPRPECGIVFASGTESFTCTREKGHHRHEHRARRAK